MAFNGLQEAPKQMSSLTLMCLEKAPKIILFNLFCKLPASWPPRIIFHLLGFIDDNGPSEAPGAAGITLLLIRKKGRRRERGREGEES